MVENGGVVVSVVVLPGVVVVDGEVGSVGTVVSTENKIKPFLLK